MPKIIINEYLYIEYTCNNGQITIIDAPNVDPKSYRFRKDGTFVFSGKKIGKVDTKTGNYTSFNNTSSPLMLYARYPFVIHINSTSSWK